jgi:hypothetical protein
VQAFFRFAGKNFELIDLARDHGAITFMPRFSAKNKTISPKTQPNLMKLDKSVFVIYSKPWATTCAKAGSRASGQHALLAPEVIMLRILWAHSLFDAVALLQHFLIWPLTILKYSQ